MLAAMLAKVLSGLSDFRRPHAAAASLSGPINLTVGVHVLPSVCMGEGRASACSSRSADAAVTLFCIGLAF